MESNIKEKMPRHIAIIMDGNGRWAKRRILNRINGHRKGVDVARDTVTQCAELGIECLTLYTFSKENWKRPAVEVGMLMKMLERHLRAEEETLIKNNIRFRPIGDIADLPESVQKVAAELVEKTASNDGMVLQLALSYSGRSDIVNAAKELARKVEKGIITPGDITEELFSRHLSTESGPDPDLLIRTSGERRISNFLLWQLAYTEIYITDVLWPDFTRKHLLDAISDYKSRDRRFGLVKEHEIVGAS